MWQRALQPDTCGVSSAAAAQHGLALVMAMLLLLLISMIGVTAIHGTNLQSRMAANQFDRHLAFQAAGRALHEAAQKLNDPASSGFIDCSTTTAARQNECATNPFTGTTTPQSIAAQPPGNTHARGRPEYIIQFVGRFPVDESGTKQISNTTHYGEKPTGDLASFYRITARSGDPGAIGKRAVVTVQALYRIAG